MITSIKQCVQGAGQCMQGAGQCVQGAGQCVQGPATHLVHLGDHFLLVELDLLPKHFFVQMPHLEGGGMLGWGCLSSQGIARILVPSTPDSRQCEFIY